MTSLEDLRQKRLDDFLQKIDNFPPVSAQLVAAVSAMFTPEKIHPSDPQMANKLIYQAGIDSVIDFLRKRHERQEAEIRREYTKE